MAVGIWVLAYLVFVAAMALYLVRQCRRPTGLPGRFIVRVMNRSHSALTAWGLKHVPPGDSDTVLDVGCGGGQTIQRLAGMAGRGKVHGVDYAEASVAASRAFNRDAVESGRVEIQRASVSRLPFPNQMFDLVTAVETHYYWPDCPADLREIYRVLKPGGSVLMVAEAYRGGGLDMAHRLGMRMIGAACFTPDEHRDLLLKAGYEETQIFLEPAKGWICATGRKPL